MCGRYSLEFDEDFYKRYRLANKLPVKSNYNVAPSQIMPAITENSPNEMEFMVWGLIPFWEEKKEKPHGLINVRDDSILNKNWAKKYIQSQRCLVPATSYFEWKKTTAGKIPYLFKLNTNKYFSFAGIYSTYKNPKSGLEIKSYSIITTTPNKTAGEVHNRMPVILQEKDEQEWLNPDLVEIDQIKDYLNPFINKDMKMYPVSTKINSPAFNNSEALKPVS